MNTEIAGNKFYLHSSMIIVLQTTMTSMTSILCRNNPLIAHVNKGKVVTTTPSISDAKKVAQMFLTDMKNESNMPAPIQVTRESQSPTPTLN
mmetsp:Transcript_26671/g.27113  ORF Transcript_26671/g.27113 Transcript_26671/m.27113 type:complete len:92 (+) Transcript_26671:2070-2345(+)